MDSRQLINFMKNDKYIKPWVGGVYARDTVPKQLKKSCVYIINLDPVYKLGSHWILLYNSENSVYFDSLGNPPVNDLVNLIPSMNKPVSYLAYRLQDYNSKTCGHFCIFFAHFLCKNVKFYEVVNMFSKVDLNYNDLLVTEFYLSMK